MTAVTVYRICPFSTPVTLTPTPSLTETVPTPPVPAKPVRVIEASPVTVSVPTAPVAFTPVTSTDTLGSTAG
mgnify:CR=1 FL=1